MIKYILQEIPLKGRTLMKNTEIAFDSFQQYFSLDIYMDIYHCTSEVMEIQLKYFFSFPCS